MAIRAKNALLECIWNSLGDGGGAVEVLAPETPLPLPYGGLGGLTGANPRPLP